MQFTLADFSDLAQVVGALAVVISLAYVATEVRHSASAVRAASGNAANLALQNVYLEVGSNLQCSSLMLRGLTSQEPLLRDEEFQFLMMLHGFLMAMQNSYFLALEGTIDPELREALTVSIMSVKDLPGFSRFWRQRRNYYLPGFTSYVEGLLARPPKQTLDVYGMETPSAIG
jgi:hypothetical protein